MKTKTGQERRTAERFPVKVLVRCIPLKGKTKGSKTPIEGWRMLAQDMAHNGICLYWPKNTEITKMPRIGEKIEIHGLVYGDSGALPMTGQIRWMAASQKPDTYTLGVKVTTPNHEDHFKAVEYAIA